jgi:hypothetical protein
MSAGTDEEVTSKGACAPSGVLLMRNDSGQLVALPLRCGRNDCPTCLAIKGRKSMLRALAFGRVVSEVGYSPLGLHTTFRFRPSREYASKCWNRLNLKLKRKVGLVAYFRAREMQARGSRHEHVMLWSSRAELSGWTTEELTRMVKPLVTKAGYGWKCELDVPRDIGQLGGYLAKYCSKAAGGFAWSYRERIYSFSRNIPQIKSTWSFVRCYTHPTELPADLRLFWNRCTMECEGDRWLAVAHHLNREEVS